MTYWDAAAPVLASSLKSVPKSTLDRVTRELSAVRMDYARVYAALSAALRVAKMPVSILGPIKNTRCTTANRKKKL